MLLELIAVVDQGGWQGPTPGPHIGFLILPPISSLYGGSRINLKESLNPVLLIAAQGQRRRARLSGAVGGSRHTCVPGKPRNLPQW